jgi:hypothetical protein
VHPLIVDLPALPAQQAGHATITRTRLTAREAVDVRGQGAVFHRLLSFVSLRVSRLPDQPTGPAFAHLEDPAQVPDGLAAALRAYHFPRLISLSMSMSSAC